MFTLLELRSFKCFELLRLPLAPLTLLTGFNASGKSSVLQALVLLHQTMREHEWSERLALNGSAAQLGVVSDVVDGVVGGSGFGIAIEDDEHMCAWDARGERRDMSMEIRRVSVDGRVTQRPQQLRCLVPPNEFENVNRLIDRLRGLSYITAERVSPQQTYPLEDPYTVTVVGPRGENAVSVLYWGRDDPVESGLALSEAPNTLLRQVAERMRPLFPGFGMDLQQAARANAVTLGLRTSDVTDFHSPIHTGFGLTQVLPIVVAALTVPKDSLILVENPEVHLHPAGQALMGQFLADVARAGIQVIVETHSDHVLSGVRRAVKERQLPAEDVAIHFFRPRSDDRPQALSPTLDDDGNIDDWPDGFFDQFDKDANYFADWGEDWF